MDATARIVLLGSTLLLALSISSGCSPDDCLPAPDSDSTPPTFSLVVTYTDAATGDRTERVIEGTESGLRLEGDPAGVVEVVYRAVDPEGVRSVQLSATVQQTVAIGTQRRVLDADPVQAGCPRPALEGRFTYRPRAEGNESFGLGLIAENWSGGRASTATYVVHFAEPRRR